MLIIYRNYPIMQSYRFESQNIFIIEKTVQFVGKIIAKSKKKVTWVIKHGENVHSIVCLLSFYSGKKKVTHNGFVIMNVEDSKQCLDCVIHFGDQKMIIMVDENTELCNPQRKYIMANDEFIIFNNMYSQPITPVYQKYFGR